MATTTDAPTTATPPATPALTPGIQDGYPVEVVIALLVLVGLLYLGERDHKIQAARAASPAAHHVPASGRAAMPALRPAGPQLRGRAATVRAPAPPAMHGRPLRVRLPAR